jgi:hypothetical protein
MADTPNSHQVKRASSESVKDLTAEVVEHGSKEQSARNDEKTNAIRLACDTRDIDALITLATSEGGFLQDDLRQLACMLPQTYLISSRHSLTRAYFTSIR